MLVLVIVVVAIDASQAGEDSRLYSCQSIKQNKINTIFSFCLTKKNFVENPQKADNEIFHYIADGCTTNGNSKEIIGHYETKNFRADTRCCSLDGQKCTTPTPHCGRSLSKQNFEEASSICKSKKQRLCTDQELLSGVCCGTGGRCDDHEVWTSTTSTSNSYDSKYIE